MRVINQLAIAGFIVAFSACTQTKQVNLPTGEEGFLVKCGDNGVYVEGMGECLRKAGEACQSGYDIISQDQYSLLIRCQRSSTQRVQDFVNQNRGEN